MTSTQITSHLFLTVMIVFRPTTYLEKEVDVDHVGEGWERDGCDKVLPQILLVSKRMANRGG